MTVIECSPLLPTASVATAVMVFGPGTSSTLSTMKLPPAEPASTPFTRTRGTAPPVTVSFTWPVTAR